jgi:hypothetical protein
MILELRSIIVCSPGANETPRAGHATAQALRRTAPGRADRAEPQVNFDLVRADDRD